MTTQSLYSFDSFRNAALIEAFGPGADTRAVHRFGDGLVFLHQHSKPQPVYSVGEVGTMYVTRTVVTWQHWRHPEFRNDIRIARCDECGKIWWQHVWTWRW